MFEFVEKARFQVGPGKKKTEESSCPDSVLQLFGNVDLTAWQGRQTDGRAEYRESQTCEMKQHSPQLTRMTAALQPPVRISQLNSTPLNRSTLNTVEICYQSKVFSTNKPPETF